MFALCKIFAAAFFLAIALLFQIDIGAKARITKPNIIFHSTDDQDVTTKKRDKSRQLFFYVSPFAPSTPPHLFNDTKAPRTL